MALDGTTTIDPQSDQDEIDRQNRLAQAMALAGSGSPQDATAVAPPPVATPQRPVALASADYSAQPSAGRVNTLQNQITAFNNPHPGIGSTLAKIALRVAPVIASAATGRGGTALNQSETEANQQAIQQKENVRQSLTQQLQAAQQAQEREYEADVNNRTRAQVAGILAGSREGVAQTAAGARTQAATTQAGARTGAAQTAAGASEYGAGQRLQGAKYAADKAQGRFDEGQDRQDARQARGIEAGYGRLGQQEDFSLNKPTAAEDNRADLSDNMKHNIAAYRDIVKRRPELFGKVGGRVTGLKEIIGSNDPDVGQLKMLEDQFAMASQGAHGMRNGHLVQGIGSAISNARKNGPDAVNAALDAAEASADTFGGINRPAMATSPLAVPGRLARSAGVIPKTKTGTGAAQPQPDFTYNLKTKKLEPANAQR